MVNEMKKFTIEHQIWEKGIGYFKIMLGDQVKYLRYREQAPGTTVIDIMIYGSEDPLAFDELPVGDWNVAELYWNKRSRGYALNALTTEQLTSIESWHPTRIDCTELPDYDQQQLDFDEACEKADALDMEKFEEEQDRIIEKAYREGVPADLFSTPYAAPKLLREMSSSSLELITMNSSFRKPCLGSNLPVVVHYDWRLDDVAGVTSKNSKVLAIIDGHNISPKVLAQVTENHHRIIGYVQQSIPNPRTPVETDLPACQAVLRSFHSFGWTFPSDSFWVGCFIMGEDGAAYINYFDTAYPTEDPGDFEKSIECLNAWFDNLEENERAWHGKFAEHDQRNNCPILIGHIDREYDTLPKL